MRVPISNLKMNESMKMNCPARVNPKRLLASRVSVMRITKAATAVEDQHDYESVSVEYQAPKVRKMN